MLCVAKVIFYNERFILTRVVPNCHETSTQETELNFLSGKRDMMIPSIMHMRMIHETSLSCGKPLERPLDSYLVKDVSHLDAPFIDPRRMGALEDQNAALRVLGRLKEEGDILQLPSLPTLSSHTALRRNVAALENDTIMRQGVHSLAMET